ncbi:MAG: FAD-dependent oxidoreductase [Flavobacteriales bacterium]|nr:FAD-dependent oxidoreductase [Flavobacteriales bacterium]
MQYDVLILGRGVAGATLAEACRRRGLAVHVFGHEQHGNATLAAGGAVNPVVLRRDVPCWRAAELMPLVHSFFGAWQQRLGHACWHNAPLVKIFASQAEAEQWQRAMERADTAPFIDRRKEAEIEAAPIRAPHGYGTVTQAGWLNIPLLLDAQRQELLAAGALTERLVREEEIQVGESGVRIGAVHGRWLVRCTGPFGDGRGLSLVKGETLTVRIPGLQITSMLYGGSGLLPLGQGLFRAGSTFKWTDVWEGPTPQARAWMLARLQALLEVPVEVVEARAGVRPAALDRKPILGCTSPHQAVINGLGARGVMQAPWCAEHLLDHLFEGRALDPEVEVSRFSPAAANR